MPTSSSAEESPSRQAGGRARLHTVEEVLSKVMATLESIQEDPKASPATRLQAAQTALKAAAMLQRFTDRSDYAPSVDDW